MTIPVVTDIDLTDDQKDRLVRMVRGNGHFDHNNAFLAAGERREVAAIRFLSEPIPDVPFAETRIDGVDGTRFDKTPWLYLEDTEGKVWGWQAARDFTPSSWHYGVIFEDSRGDAWFCGRNEPTGGVVDADAPILRRISLQTPEHVVAENGELCENLPAEGEFWLTGEDLATVTSIPWWSPMGHDGTTRQNNPEAHARDQALIAALRRRVDTHLGLKPDVLVRFTPQAWVNDNAIPVDPEGADSWTVPLDDLLEHCGGQLPDDDRYESDDIRTMPQAPAWARDWGGPFCVSIVNRDEIEAFLAEASAPEETAGEGAPSPSG